MMEKTTIYLTPELHRALKDAARVEKKPQADVLRRALEEYLGRQERPLPLSVGLGEDEKLSGADSEEWLHEQWGGA
jgi:predicted transcriptional regulator